VTLLALQYIARATTKLRESMVSQKKHPAGLEDQLRLQHIWSVYALLSAEVAAHNFKAAKVHGLMLARLLQPDGLVFRPEPRLLMGALMQDTTRACLSLSRPSLDLARWDDEHLPRRVTDLIAVNRQNAPSALPAPTELPPDLSGSLCVLFLGVRNWHHALGQLMLDTSLASVRGFTCGAMKIMVLMGHLLNHYLDSMDLYDQTSAPELLVEACLGLAASYWARRAVHDRLDAGSKLEQAGSFAFDMSYVVAIRLRELDEQIADLDVVSLEGKHRGYAEQDRLWWMFVGTMAERNVHCRNDCGDYQDYFGTRFLEQVRVLGFKGWQEIEAVLRQYLHLQQMGLKVKKWFLANQGVS
jgi:hypothetical protein